MKRPVGNGAWIFFVGLTFTCIGVCAMEGDGSSEEDFSAVVEETFKQGEMDYLLLHGGSRAAPLVASGEESACGCGPIFDDAKGERFSAFTRSVVADDPNGIFDIVAGEEKPHELADGSLRGGLRCSCQQMVRKWDAQLDCYPLHAAVIRGAIDSVRVLLAEKVEVNRRGAHGRTPLHAALAYGLFFMSPEHIDRLAQRLAAARRIPCDRSRRCPQPLSRRAESLPITACERRRCVHIVEPGREQKADAPAQEVRKFRGRSRSQTIFDMRGTLFRVHEGKRQGTAYCIAELLLGAGAQPHLADSHGYTPLQLAVLQHGEDSDFIRKVGQLMGPEHTAPSFCWYDVLYGSDSETTTTQESQELLSSGDFTTEASESSDN